MRTDLMIERTKQTWQEFKGSDPGQRFQDRYTRRQQAEHGRWDKRTMINIVLGVAITLAGLFLVPAPGPGWIVALLGLGLLGSEFAPIARVLDRAEMKARGVASWAQGVWDRSPLVVKALLVLVGVIGLVALGYGAYRLLVGG